MSDLYHTLRTPAERTLKVSGSRFIAFAAPVQTREEAMEVVELRRAGMFDATHHAFAYRVTPDGTGSRMFDDGEPAGTAGRPILAAIDHESLTNVVVVVTRYFGGTKLGVGGLARAYGEAAASALSAAGREERTIVTTVGIAFPFAMMGQVMHAVTRTGGKVIRSSYDDQVHMSIEVRRSAGEEFFALLVESTSGAVRREDG
jgi:uncharacterized YigZ family protein